MSFKLLIVLLVISPSSQQKSSALESNTSIIRIPEVQNNYIIWEKLCDHIRIMLQTTDVAEKNRVDVVIHDFSAKSNKHKYEGFYALLANGRISMKIIDYSIKVEEKIDYAILLISEDIVNYNHFIMNTFSTRNEDKSLKIIAIMSDYKSIINLNVVWSALVNSDYYNVYLISHTAFGTYNLFRTNYKFQSNGRPGFITEKTHDTKFVLFKNRLSVDARSYYSLSIVFYNNFPMSFMRNGQIVGAEGNLLRELTTKLNVTYNIDNNPETAMSMTQIVSLLKTTADICLFTNFIMFKKYFDGAWIHDMDGLCLLVPRNIPVSSYENFTLPLDSISLILSFISTVLLIVAWKIISMYTGSRRSISSILFSVYDLILNLGASGLEELTSHENIMIYCFIFGSFFLMSFYETAILSFMLTDSTMRSALSLQELNDSNTKFYSFYDTNISRSGNLPMIRDELIISHVNIFSMPQLEVPENFNENLVYLVTCKYADSFSKSSNNYREYRRLFDKLTLTQTIQRITTRSDFFYIEELRDMIERFEESGIYKSCEKDMIQNYQQGFRASNIIDSSGHDYIEFGDIGLPLVVLLVGCLISFIVFLSEFISHRCRTLLSNKVNVVRRLKIRKINLDKWERKYIFKKKLKLSKHEDVNKESIVADASLISKQEFIKSRESVKGGYFMIKKFGQHKIKRKGIRRIQVQPYQETST